LPATAETGRVTGRAERIAIRVDGAQDGPVEIHLQERRGEVHMSLRAASPEMVERIRDSLPHLSDRLQAEGFEAETWRPDDTLRANADLSQPESQDLNREGRGRYHQEAEPQNPGNGKRQSGETFAEVFETKGEQE
jgi:hypothetical protein